MATDEGSRAADDSGRTTDDRGRARTIGKVALGVVVAAGLLYGGAVLLVHTLLDSESLRQQIQPRMETALNREVELGGVELSFFPGVGVELHDLTVASPAEMDAPDVVTAGEIHLGIALLPLLRRRVRIDRASAEGVDLQLVALGDGRSNFGDFVPEGDTASTDGGDGSFALEIREVRLERSRATYRDLAAGRELDAEGISGRATLERGEDGRWEVEARVATEALDGRGLPAAERWGGSPAGVDLAGRAGADGGWLEIASGTARIGALELSVAGRVDDLQAGERTLDLRVHGDDLPAADLAAFAGDGTADRVSGVLGVDLEISGTVGGGAAPEAAGTVTLRDGRYVDEDGAPIAEALEAEAALAGDSVLLRRLTGRLLDGPLEAEGGLDLAGVDRPFHARLSAEPRLERRPGAGESDSLDLSGALALDVELDGRAEVPSSARIRGTATPRDVVVRRPRWRGPVELPGRAILLEGDRAVADGSPVVVGGDTLRFTGRVERLVSHLDEPEGRPQVDGTLTGERLDLGVLFPPDDEGASYAQLAFAHLGGRSVGGRDAAEIAAERGLSRPGAPPVGGGISLEVGEVLYGTWRLSDVRGRLVLDAGLLEIRDAGFALLGGRASGAVSLELGPGARQPFTVRLAFEEVQGPELLSRLTPAGELFSGTTSLRLEAAGTLDTLLLPAAPDLAGDGQLEVVDGRMQENPVTRAAARRLSLPALRAPGFDRFVLPFTLRGDSLQFPSTTLQSDSLGVRLDGGMGLDGTLDLTAGLELPQRLLSSLSLPDGALPEGGAGDVLRDLVGEADLTQAVSLAIGGTTADPSVQVKFEPDALGASGGIREKGRERLGERALDLFGRVLGDRDSPADSAAADSLPPDGG